MAIPTLAMIPSGYKAGKLYSVLPSDGTGDFTVARNSVATRVNQSGLIEEVGVNVPRLDYSAGGCPVLLTEIQSQNKITYSEDFSNSVWDNSSQVTRTANATISPDGTLNAFNIKPTNVNSNHTLRAQNLGGFTSGSVVNASFFAKQNGYKYISVIGGFGSSNTPSVIFNLEDGLIESGTGTIENYGNGWYRCIAPITLNSTSLYCVATILNDNLLGSFVGDNVKGVYVYGFQIEQQPAATSYIKSNIGSATTREADLVNGAGSAATFNSLEHTFFVDLNSMFQSGTTSAISIVGSTGTVSSNRIMILKQANNTDVTFQIKSGGATAATETLSNIDSSVRQKLVITVKLNEVKYYRNGFLFATDTGTIPLPVSLGEITLTSGTTGSPLAASTKDIRYYNQVLTEAETLELMSYDSFNEMASALQYTIK